MSPVVKTRGLLLRRFDYSETSLVVHFFTEDFGAVRALAKGAKREKSPLHGALEPLTLSDIVFYRKKAPGLHILSQARTERTWRGLRARLDAFYAAHHVAALLLAAAPEDLAQPELFAAAVTAFTRLEEGRKPRPALFAFEATLLRLMGNFPRDDVCPACGDPLERGQRVVFHPLSGGALHPDCARAREITGPTVAAGTLKVLRQFAEGGVTRTDRITLAPAVEKELRALLDADFRFLLDRDLRTRPFLD